MDFDSGGVKEDAGCESASFGIYSGQPGTKP
jgi:hypothetical protein